MKGFPVVKALLCWAGVVSGAVGIFSAANAQGTGHDTTYVSPVKGAGNFLGQTDRPLRYQPAGTDFVIENGGEFFNRPLYGTHTAFRIDAGDEPELSLYLPGHGGNLRIGIRAGSQSKWLHETARRIARYRAGSLIYEIHDPLIGDAGAVIITALATSGTEGLIVRAELRGASTQPLELIWAYAGADGKKGRRSGDIGTEEVPISQFFQVVPASCRGNSLSMQADRFELHAQIGTIKGFVSPGTELVAADCAQWANLQELLASRARKDSATAVRAPAAALAVSPAAIATAELRSDEPRFIALLRDTGIAPTDLVQTFADAENYRRAIAERVVIETPDPYINAAMAALLIAADGIWDDAQNAFMHGAVAWRSKLLGWRGPYAGDALGWHDRARRHFVEWSKRQNTSPIPTVPPNQDPTVGFARSEPSLHTNGDLSNSHYDMNLVYVDALFRHLLWTGDLDFAQQMWPVIERHLAWERCSFRRTFGAKQIPLYEGYAAIWASDDLEYHGGGAAHSSAYNYFHNLLAARLAKRLGKDAALYEKEAADIRTAIQSELWLPEQGWLAEWKDALGLKLAHPSAAVWSVYHAIDSEALDTFQAYQATRYVDTQIPHLPIQDGYYTLSTSTWMPYTWSINNVVMAESVHTALSFWQANRADEAFRLFKGALLDSMYLGLTPGNAGMTTAFDMARREAQRDFGDAVGILSRTFIEGLFGVRADALEGELRIQPGFPAEWSHASIRHPDFNFRFERSGRTDRYELDSKWSCPLSLRLLAAAPWTQVASVTVNGRPAGWRSVETAVATPRIEIRAPAAARYSVVIDWRGDPPVQAGAPAFIAQGAKLRMPFNGARVVAIEDPQHALSSAGKVVGTLGHRTVFAKLNQGELTWWQAVPFEIRAPVELTALDVRNNDPALKGKRVLLKLDGQADATQTLPAAGESSPITLPTVHLIPGTHRISAWIGKRLIAQGEVTDWRRQARDNIDWRTLDLTSVFNDRVTQIFRNEYLAPRPHSVSLSIPKQGYGSWAHWDAKFEVDDSGLRAAAAGSGGHIKVSGVPFNTPTHEGAPNIAFTSRWDNYLPETLVPLSGKSSHAYLLMAGSTNWMQSRFDNGEVIVTYANGTTERLPLHNPTNWWPIDQDYFIDDFAFRRPEPIPPRVDLKTGTIRILDLAQLKGRGGAIPGGAATVLDLPLDPQRELRSLLVRTLSNEVIIGLMALTLAPPTLSEK